MMRGSTTKHWLSIAASTILVLAAGQAARAQQVTGPATAAAGRPLAEVLAQISQSAGAVVLADSTVFGRVPVPAAPATPQTLEQQIAELVQALPPGTTWAKLYLPAPANGRWHGDVVAGYARSLAALVGTVGRGAPAGMVEILGRPIPADRANDVISALNLKLVYLITNPRAPTVAASGVNWSGMSPDQRQAYAQAQAQRLLALDPASRVQAVMQMMQQQEESPQQAIMRQVLSQMPDDERVQVKMGLGAIKGAVAGGGGK